MNDFDNNLGSIRDVLDQIMELSDEHLNDQVIEALNGMINGAITPSIQQQAIDSLIKTFEAQNYTREYVKTILDDYKTELNSYIEGLQPSSRKRELINNVNQIMCNIFDIAYERYHTYDFELPVLLGEGAQMPTYAHETDAAADIYAAETITLLAHTEHNVVKTNLRIALPERWVAYILPRSSIGMKTGLRLSNSVGVIDSDYRGEIGVMYDNISDSEYTIQKGDRIAQMIIMPVHQFKPVSVDALDETDRGEGGFGSTGK